MEAFFQGDTIRMNIRVKVYAPGFVDHEPIDASGYVELLEGDSVGILFQKLRVPLPIRYLLPCTVNYQLAPMSTILRDGDIVTVLFPISGG